MRLDYINPIIDSAVNVLADFTSAPVKRGTMQLQQGSTRNNDVAAIIGIAGEVEGRIILEMGRDTALSMAGMMNDEQFTELSPLALDTLMELANVMVARAVSALNDKGYAFRLTPPLIFTGANLSTFNNLSLETLVIPLYAKAGDMDLNVALRLKTI
ncbi:MAG TPA: chemotaxis protein CheX [Nitrospiraceae bacterium]|nr:chemotaxis protein CheX [Nitrospiraceae bacterium]